MQASHFTAPIVPESLAAAIPWQQAERPGANTPSSKPKTPAMVRQRHKHSSETKAAAGPEALSSARKGSHMTHQDASVDAAADLATKRAGWSTRTQWIFFAMASGVCAAFNGAFAKLTTTELTTTLSTKISNLLGLSEYEQIIEYVVRALFFILNLVFNGIMWSLFTTALARGTSATQVSIMNTSSNFIVTALLGIAVFSEKLPPLWWAGASLLVVGNVITGRRNDGDESAAAEAVVEAEPLLVQEAAVDEPAYKDDSDSNVPDVPTS